jgi:hypothetical protein
MSERKKNFLARVLYPLAFAVCLVASVLESERKEGPEHA